MKIVYSSRKLEKLLNNATELKKHYGELSRKISQRISELRNADNLAVMRTIIAARCHELTGNLSGFLAVKVSPNKRLLFSPNHDPVPKLPDNGLDWENVTSICIEKVDEDYH